MNNPETIKKPEKELSSEAKHAAKHLEVLREKHEKVGELKQEKKEHLESARHEIEKLNVETEKKPEHNRHATSVERYRVLISKSERDKSFNSTMKEVRTHMSAPSRAFSKVIHNKTIEKTSEILGGTVARPNAILSGAIFAFVLTLAAYLVAKNLGYPLSGFESIGTFALGWIIGLTYDFLKVMVTGRQ